MNERAVFDVVQLVGYEPSGRGSSIIVADDGDIERHRLRAGTSLSLQLGTRRCAGLLEGEIHYPCDRQSSPYCPEHADSWICARCTGTCLKAEMDCFQTHAVYLAAFPPDTFKVGVTKLDRLETRLREQGAHRGAHVHTVSNGRIARELEAEIATRLVDRVRIETKIDGLASSLDLDAWNRLLDEFDVIDRYAFDYGFDLDRRPIRETMATGTVVGVQGRLLVLERGGTTYVVDMRDLVGYDLDESDGEARLQSSLGSFESA